MSTTTSKFERSRRLLSALSVAGSAVAIGGALFVFRGCSSSDVETTNAATATPAKKDPVSAVEIPKFGRPEEAARYFDAVIEGDRRSIDLIDRALAESKAQANVNSSAVAELEREREVRATRLMAYEKARRSAR